MTTTARKFYRPTLADLRSRRDEVVARLAYLDDRHGETPWVLECEFEDLTSEIEAREGEGEEG